MGIPKCSACMWDLTCIRFGPVGVRNNISWVLGSYLEGRTDSTSLRSRSQVVSLGALWILRPRPQILNMWPYPPSSTSMVTQRALLPHLLVSRRCGRPIWRRSTNSRKLPSHPPLTPHQSFGPMMLRRRVAQVGTSRSLPRPPRGLRDLQMMFVYGLDR